MSGQPCGRCCCCRCCTRCSCREGEGGSCDSREEVTSEVYSNHEEERAPRPPAQQISDRRPEKPQVPVPLTDAGMASAGGLPITINALSHHAEQKVLNLFSQHRHATIIKTASTTAAASGVFAAVITEVTKATATDSKNAAAIRTFGDFAQFTSVICTGIVVWQLLSMTAERFAKDRFPWAQPIFEGAAIFAAIIFTGWWPGALYRALHGA